MSDPRNLRIQELITANNDLSNLLASVELPIVILRDDMTIRRFTPAAKQLLNLIDADVGRPISNILPNVTIPELKQRVFQVTSTMMAQSLEVQDKDGHWYVLRLRKALQQERRLAAVVRDSGDAITVQDFSGSILTWNRRAAEIYGYSEEEALQLNSEILIAERSVDQMKGVIKQLQLGKKITPCESWRRNKDGREIKMWLTVSLLFDEAGKPAAIAFTEQDIT